MPPPPSPAGTPLGAWVRILCGGAANSNPPSRGEAYSLTPPNGGETIREDPRGGARSSYPCIRGSASQPSNPRPRGEAYLPTLRIGGEDWGNTARSNTHAAPYPTSQWGGGVPLPYRQWLGSPHCLLGSYKGTSSAGANSRLRPAASRVRIPLPYPTDEGPLGARLTACGEAASLPVGQGGKTRGIQRGVRAALPSSGPRVLAGYLGKRHADQSWPP